MFNEISLRDEIYKTWGEHGAHADVYRELLKRASKLKEPAPSASTNTASRQLPTFDDFCKWFLDPQYSHASKDIYQFFTGNWPA